MLILVAFVFQLGSHERRLGPLIATTAAFILQVYKSFDLGRIISFENYLCCSICEIVV